MKIINDNTDRMREIASQLLNVVNILCAAKKMEVDEMLDMFTNIEPNKQEHEMLKTVQNQK